MGKLLKGENEMIITLGIIIGLVGTGISAVGSIIQKNEQNRMIDDLVKKHVDNHFK